MCAPEERHRPGIGGSIGASSRRTGQGAERARMSANAGLVPSLGEIVRRRRELAELPIRRLADMVGSSGPYLSQIERSLRRPSERGLQAIAAALRTSADAIRREAGADWDPPPGMLAAIAAGSAAHRAAAAGFGRDLPGLHRGAEPRSAPELTPGRWVAVHRNALRAVFAYAAPTSSMSSALTVSADLIHGYGVILAASFSNATMSATPRS